jgi:hypothetical protein
MTDSTLGLRMGKILLRQSREHGSLDRRSVQGLVGEVCGSDQQELLPALRYVVLCEPFLEALRATPPLGDPQPLIPGPAGTPPRQSAPEGAEGGKQSPRSWRPADQAVPQKVTSGNLSLASSRDLPRPSSCQ